MLPGEDVTGPVGLHFFVGGSSASFKKLSSLVLMKEKIVGHDALYHYFEEYDLIELNLSKYFTPISKVKQSATKAQADLESRTQGEMVS